MAQNNVEAGAAAVASAKRFGLGELAGGEYCEKKGKIIGTSRKKSEVLKPGRV